jgi:hypothetical protein
MLGSAGFEDLGTQDEMIALMRQTGGDVSELLHAYTYINDARHLRVLLTDYTDVSTHLHTSAYQRPVGPFLEFCIYEERPGGFSSSANQFLADLQERLRSIGTVTLVTPPPPTDDEEYRRVTRGIFVTGILGWLGVFGITVGITGGISYIALRRAPISRGAKRTVFVLVNTWLAAPLPFPLATVLITLLPNLLAIPWTNWDYYRRVQSVAVVSFPIAMALCALIAIGLFRGSSAEQSTAGSVQREARGPAAAGWAVAIFALALIAAIYRYTFPSRNIPRSVDPAALEAVYGERLDQVIGLLNKDDEGQRQLEIANLHSAFQSDPSVLRVTLPGPGVDYGGIFNYWSVGSSPNESCSSSAPNASILMRCTWSSKGMSRQTLKYKRLVTYGGASHELVLDLDYKNLLEVMRQRDRR